MAAEVSQKEFKELQAMVSHLVKENEALKAAAANRSQSQGTVRTFKIGETNDKGDEYKGTVGVVITGRQAFITYPSSWLKVFRNLSAICRQTIADADALGWKASSGLTEDQIKADTLRFMEAFGPKLDTLIAEVDAELAAK